MTTPTFSGKYVHKSPGPSKKILAQFKHGGPDIDDLHIYTYPTSIWSDTPDFVTVRIRHDGRIIGSGINLTTKGVFGTDSFGIEKIDPPIKEGDSLSFELEFDEAFDEDQGYVIVGTKGGAIIAPRIEDAAIEVPAGPSTIDVLIEAIKLGSGAAKTLIGSSEAPSESGSAREAALAALSGREPTPKRTMLLAALSPEESERAEKKAR